MEIYGKIIQFILGGLGPVNSRVRLSRSRERWLVSTPSANAVQGAHAIAVANQAFAAWGRNAGAKCLPLMEALIPGDTLVIERTLSERVRLTLSGSVRLPTQVADRGQSQWPGSDDAEALTEALCQLLERQRPLARGLAPARLLIDGGSLDEPSLILWVARWRHERCKHPATPKRIVSEFAALTGASVEAAAELLALE